MYFLIDLENVSGSGFTGTELLNGNDTVIVFCSRFSHTVSGCVWERLLRSGCKIEKYDLEKTGHNALDFCIASCVGEIASLGTEKQIAVVSNDKGYGSIREYWKKSRGISIIVQKDVTRCILMSRDARRFEAKRFTEKIDVRTAVVQRRRQYVIENLLSNELRDRDCLDALKFSEACLDSSLTPKERYRRSLATFGWGKGIEVYRAIKATITKMETRG